MTVISTRNRRIILINMIKRAIRGILSTTFIPPEACSPNARAMSDLCARSSDEDTNMYEPKKEIDNKITLVMKTVVRGRLWCRLIASSSSVVSCKHSWMHPLVASKGRGNGDKNGSDEISTSSAPAVCKRSRFLLSRRIWLELSKYTSEKADMKCANIQEVMPDWKCFKKSRSW